MQQYVSQISAVYIVKKRFLPEFTSAPAAFTLSPGHIVYVPKGQKFVEGRTRRKEPTSVFLEPPARPFEQIDVQKTFPENRAMDFHDYVWGPYGEQTLRMGLWFASRVVIGPDVFDVEWAHVNALRHLVQDHDLQKFFDSEKFYEAFRGRACITASEGRYAIARPIMDSNLFAQKS